jgi:acyl dehydratase
VHGLFVASMFGGILGSQFPGSIYMLQNLLFKAPCFVGASVTARLEVPASQHAIKLLQYFSSDVQVSNINADKRIVIWRSTATVRFLSSARDFNSQVCSPLTEYC